MKQRNQRRSGGELQDDAQVWLQNVMNSAVEALKMEAKDPGVEVVVHPDVAFWAVPQRVRVAGEPNAPLGLVRLSQTPLWVSSRR